MTIHEFKRKTYEEAIIKNIPKSWKRDAERVKNTQCDLHKVILSALSSTENKQDLYDTLVVALCMEIKWLREAAQSNDKEPTPDWLIQIHTKLDDL